MIEGGGALPRTIEPNTLFIGYGVTIKGDIAVSRVVYLEGSVEGSISGPAVWIGPSGSIKGMLCVTEAEIHGLVTEKVVVTGRLRIHPTGRVVGDVSYKELVLERGGTISGRCAPLETEPEVTSTKMQEAQEQSSMHASDREDTPATVINLFQR